MRHSNGSTRHFANQRNQSAAVNLDTSKASDPGKMKTADMRSRMPAVIAKL